ncbi:acyltransferase family protein [Klebsiella pneumoniae]|uniref:acyltransferase family protein n=1 Tax=Klebsiella pneumoniae TaxID=573 RepID=UPI000E5AC183|nr:acyltransferase [Klebsiella pneumoniae]
MNKLNYIHSIRGIAAFFIVLIHCNIFMSKEGMLNAFFYHFLTEWTAIFLLISGFLFQFLLPKYEFSSFMKKKITNVILPYIIVSIPAILIYLLGYKTVHNWIDVSELLSNSKLYTIFYFYLTGGHLGPLWFIPVLTLIFFVSKPLKFIGSNQVILSICAFISVFIVLVTSRPENDSNPIIAFIHFLPVYIIGMFFCSFREILIKESYKYGYLLLFVTFFCLEVYWDLSSSVSILNKFILFLSLCFFFYSSPKYFLLSIMADISFALYFLHGYFVGALRILQNRIDPNLMSGFWFGFVSSILCSIIISLIIFCIYSLIRKSNLVNSRLLIGS